MKVIPMPLPTPPVNLFGDLPSTPPAGMVIQLHSRVKRHVKAPKTTPRVSVFKLD